MDENREKSFSCETVKTVKTIFPIIHNFLTYKMWENKMRFSSRVISMSYMHTYNKKKFSSKEIYKLKLYILYMMHISAVCT